MPHTPVRRNSASAIHTPMRMVICIASHTDTGVFVFVLRFVTLFFLVTIYCYYILLSAEHAQIYCFFEDMFFHCLGELLCSWRFCEGEFGVQRVEFEIIAVWAVSRWRAGSAIAFFTPTVESALECVYVFCVYFFCFWRDVVQHTVIPHTAACCVRVVYDECQ